MSYSSVDPRAASSSPLHLRWDRPLPLLSEPAELLLQLRKAFPLPLKVLKLGFVALPFRCGTV